MMSAPAARSARMLSAKLCSLVNAVAKSEVRVRREVVDDLHHRGALVAAPSWPGSTRVSAGRSPEAIEAASESTPSESTPTVTPVPVTWNRGPGRVGAVRLVALADDRALVGRGGGDARRRRRRGFARPRAPADALGQLGLGRRGDPAALVGEHRLRGDVDVLDAGLARERLDRGQRHAGAHGRCRRARRRRRGRRRRFIAGATDLGLPEHVDRGHGLLVGGDAGGHMADAGWRRPCRGAGSPRSAGASRPSSGWRSADASPGRARRSGRSSGADRPSRHAAADGAAVAGSASPRLVAATAATTSGRNGRIRVDPLDHTGTAA